MKVHVLAGALALAAFAAAPSAQQPADTREAHCAAARAAAGTEYLALYNRFAEVAVPAISPTGPRRRRGCEGGAGTRDLVPAARKGVRQPVLRRHEAHSAWALQTSDGLIVIDALFDYAVKDSVVEGLRKLGLNPATMKYLIISHGHGDHHGGAKYLQDEFGPRVVMGAPDWDLVAKNPRDPIPRRDIAASDGQKITLGDTTVTLYSTPGHTAGTFSLIIPVKDGGRPASPRDVGRHGGGKQHAGCRGETVRGLCGPIPRLALETRRRGIISNHTDYDSSIAKLQELAARKPGEPHPFLTGVESVRRYLTVAEEVGRAALAATAGK